MYPLRKTLLISPVLSLLLFGGCGSVTKTENGLDTAQTASLKIMDRQYSQNEQDQPKYPPKRIDTSAINYYMQDHGCKTYEDAEDGKILGWQIYDNDPAGAWFVMYLRRIIKSSV